MESDSYQHLPSNDSGQYDTVALAAATEDQARDLAEDDDRHVLQEELEETNDDIQLLNSTEQEEDCQQLVCQCLVSCVSLTF